MSDEVVLDMEDLRAVAAFAAASAADVLALFEQSAPADPRPRRAVDAALAFARGGPRNKALRDAAWASLKAAQQADNASASQAARAAMPPRQPPICIPWRAPPRSGTFWAPLPTPPAPVNLHSVTRTPLAPIFWSAPPNR